MPSPSGSNAPCICSVRAMCAAFCMSRCVVMCNDTLVNSESTAFVSKTVRMCFRSVSIVKRLCHLAQVVQSSSLSRTRGVLDALRYPEVAAQDGLDWHAHPRVDRKGPRSDLGSHTISGR